MSTLSKDNQVEQLAIDLFQQLNLGTYYAYDEVLAEEGLREISN